MKKSRVQVARDLERKGVRSVTATWFISFPAAIAIFFVMKWDLDRRRLLKVKERGVYGDIYKPDSK